MNPICLSFYLCQMSLKGEIYYKWLEMNLAMRLLVLYPSMTGLSFKESQTLFLNVWLVTHGIGFINGTNDCDF